MISSRIVGSREPSDLTEVISLHIRCGSTVAAPWCISPAHADAYGTNDQLERAPDHPGAPAACLSPGCQTVASQSGQIGDRTARGKQAPAEWLHVLKQDTIG